MLKKAIQYQTYDEPPKTVVEDFYFNMTKLEAAELELELGGLEETIKAITATSDAKKAYGLFKEILLSSVGRKSPDGRQFLKEDENGVPYSKQFENSPACGELVIELLQNPTYAAEFVKGILPAQVVAEGVANGADDAIQKELDKLSSPQLAKIAAIRPEESVQQNVFEPVPPEEDKPVNEYTHDELVSMPQAQFDRVAGPEKNWTKPVLLAAFHRKSR
jgi:hypothetical protein